MRLIATVLLAVALVAAFAACDTPVDVPVPGTPAPGGAQGIDAAAWAGAMCQSVDQLEQAVGDPTTGQRSTAWQEFETALTGSDEASLKAAADGVLGHLTEGSRQAASATSFEPGRAAAAELQALHDGLADGVRTLRDGALTASVDGVNDGRQRIDAAIEGHYEQALGQMTQVPLGGVPLPCA